MSETANAHAVKALAADWRDRKDREDWSAEDQAALDAWLAQSGGFEKYFFLNVQHGIRTPDDLDIWKRMKLKAPAWLGQAAYSSAIKTLQADSS